VKQLAGARALTRALFLSAAIHVLVIGTLPAAPEGRVGPLSLSSRIDARLGFPESPAPEQDPLPAAIGAPTEVPEQVQPDRSPALSSRHDEGVVQTQPHPFASAAGPNDRTASRPSGSIVPDELLTLRPVPVRIAELDTRELRKIPAAGRIILDLTVRTNGRVSNVLVVFCDLPGPYLAHAMKTFTEATYRPGEVLGDAVDSRLRVEISVLDGVPSIVEQAPALVPAPLLPMQPPTNR
jgi:hypothetical protein